MDLFSLNPSQQEAASATEGFVRVIAGAGSGKTRALSYRFAYLVNELGILPGNILCVTFTNKSANEMRQRIHQLTGDNDTGYICTFHSFCVSVLQEDSHVVQYPKSFLVLDNSDIDQMLKIIYEERGLTLRHMTFSRARDMIEIRKCQRNPDYYLDMLDFSPEALKQKYLEATEPEDIIFYGYLYQEKKCFGLDYNDLIKFTLYIFEQDALVRRKWQERLEYIMIDEFQDIDDLQYRLMNVLCGYHGNLFVVGDPDQTIYTWRGANLRYLLDFERNHPGAKTIMMMQNYRSTPQILSVANSLIEKNTGRIKKDLLPMLPSGKKVVCHYADTAEKEAKYIAEEIRRLNGQGVALRDITILYRAHYLTRSLEEVFLKEQLPYVIYSGIQFFQRAEIRDALAYLRMIAYQDDLSFQRIANTPRRNLGERRMEFLQEYAEQNGCSLFDALRQNLEHEQLRGTKAASFVRLIEKFSAEYAGLPVSEVLADILSESGYEEMLRTLGSQERLDNLAELKQSVFEYETSCGEECTLEHYITHVALFSNTDVEGKKDAVKMMTVHAAKGLEFPYVFLCGMNEGIFPSKKTSTREGMEEERRLAFVAITRAEQGLYLTEAGGRGLDGSPRYPSRFLLDIDPSLLAFTHEPREGLIAAAKSYIHAQERHLGGPEEDSYLAVGTRVKHFVFGEGTVVGIDRKKEAHVIQFEGMDTPRRLAVRARLEVIDSK